MTEHLRPLDRLPIVPELCHEESLLGYVARCAEANVHSSCDWIIELLGTAPERLSFNLVGLGRLAELTALPRQHLRARGYPLLGSGRCQILGDDMPKPFVSVATRRYCPQCLSAASYHRAIWDVRLLAVCPEHGLWLRASCDCGRKLPWRWPSIGFCPCGRSLAGVASRAASQEQYPSGEGRDLRA